MRRQGKAKAERMYEGFSTQIKHSRVFPWTLAHQFHMGAVAFVVCTVGHNIWDHGVVSLKAYGELPAQFYPRTPLHHSEGR